MNNLFVIYFFGFFNNSDSLKGNESKRNEYAPKNIKKANSRRKKRKNGLERR